MPTLVGLLLLVMAGRSGYSTYQLEKEGVRTTGIIIALESSSLNLGRYYPVVRFTTKEGEKITFKSSFGSSFAGSSQGTETEVLYWPENPQAAQIAGYFGSIFLAALGTMFAFAGGAPLLATRHRKKQKAYLLHRGRPVTASIIKVNIERPIEVGGRSPYSITCLWVDKLTHKAHFFNSEDINFDPSPYLHDRKITVYIDGDNAKKYYVDISFLPEKA